MNTSLTVYLLGAYFIILLLIGIFSAKNESSESYLIADRKVKWLSLAATLSSSYMGGGALVLLASWAYQYGFSVLWVGGGAALAFIFLMIVSPKIKKLSDEKKFYTISDYIYQKFDRRTGILGTTLMFLYFFCWVMIQFVGGGVILAHLSGFSYAYSVLLVGIVILIYLLLAGFKAVVKTDFFQYLIMIVFGVFVLNLAIKGIDLPSEGYGLLSGIGGVGGAVGFLVLGAIVTLMSGDIWQRMYAAKNQKHLNGGLLGATISILLLGAVLTAIGFWVQNHFPGTNPQDAFVIGITNILPPALFSFGLLIILASIMSTADTVLFAMSLNLSRDLLYHFKKLNDQSLVKYTRLGILLLTVIAIAISLTTQDVSTLGFYTAMMVFPLGPLIIASFYKKIKNSAAFYSVLLGALTILILILTNNVTETNVALPFFVSLVALVPLQIFSRK